MNNRGRQQMIVGQVVSDKMDKTVVVRVEKKVPHPVYKKYVKKYNKFFAHCDKLFPGVGDIVKIASIRPISKNKRWRVIEIVRESIKIG